MYFLVQIVVWTYSAPYQIAIYFHSLYTLERQILLVPAHIIRSTVPGYGVWALPTAEQKYDMTGRLAPLFCQHQCQFRGKLCTCSKSPWRREQVSLQTQQLALWEMSLYYHFQWSGKELCAPPEGRKCSYTRGKSESPICRQLFWGSCLSSIQSRVLVS